MMNLMVESIIITGIATINQLKIGTLGETLVGITSILDENDMASNSATALATQQSIKKYVDAKIGQFQFSDGISIPVVTLEVELLILIVKHLKLKVLK